MTLQHREYMHTPNILYMIHKLIINLNSEEKKQICLSL